MHYLPNKKFIKIAVISLLIIGGGFFILKNYNSKKSQKSEQQLSSVSEPITAQELNKDSDNDGLKDWEEALWDTDPHNPDTDGDGVSDGQEVKEGRNPLVAGDGKTDKMKNPTLEKNATANATQKTETPSTLTDAFSKIFISEYMNLQQQGDQPLNETDKTDLTNYLTSAMDNAKENTSEQNEYLKSDIKIAPQDNEETIKEYGNNLALIIKKYFDPLHETELTIFNKALQLNRDTPDTEDYKIEIKKLKPIADAYRNTANNMISLTVPIDFSDAHLRLTNYFNNIAKELDKMGKFFLDPIQGMLALQQYQTDSAETYLILQNLNVYFSDKKVAFATDEPAEFFKFYAAAKSL